MMCKNKMYKYLIKHKKNTLNIYNNISIGH